MQICVIGGGPGGMFFCHAIEYHRRQLEAEGKSEEAQLLPAVTVIERSEAPGGVWKASPHHGGTDSANMYAGLWTNGPSPSLEFWDYTFQEHFGRPVHPYMPRQLILDYMLGRVTSKCPDFFEKYFEFRTNVEHVVFDDALQQFKVQSTKEEEATTTRYFDKCIWAAGKNGKPFVPKALKQTFLDGGFPGRMIHSTETQNLKEDVQDKKVLMIGGSLSAEDLAIMAIKLGVSQVYISSRSYSDEYSDVKRWPYNKVELLEYTMVHSVAGNVVHLTECVYDWPGVYSAKEPLKSFCWCSRRSESITRSLEIDTVIFCTGYSLAMEMLDKSLQFGYPDEPSGSSDGDFPLDVPSDFIVNPHGMDKFVHMPKVTGRCVYLKSVVHPHFFRGVSIDQPNFMVVNSFGSYTPLLGLDVSAWYFARLCMGQLELPSAVDMRKRNHQQALNDLHSPLYRLGMDEDFFNAHREMEELEGYEEAYGIEQKASEKIVYVFIATVMRECDYPFSLGTRDGLNRHGEDLVEFDNISWLGRVEMATEELPWRTFRDLPDEMASQMHSVYTGTPCDPLPERWLDIDSSRFAEDFFKRNCIAPVADQEEKKSHSLPGAE